MSISELRRGTGDRYRPIASLPSAAGSRLQSFVSVTSSPSSSGLESPYFSHSRPLSLASLARDFPLSADPDQWGANVSPDNKEADDDLHQPDPRDKPRRIEREGPIFTWRGFVNVGFLVLVVGALLTLFAGYPIITHFRDIRMGTLGGYNLGGTNASGQVPTLPGNHGLIDEDTPTSAYHTLSRYDGKTEMTLVFSDEFNTPGRTFWPGDDPYWEAVNLHYWETNNLEWYHPNAIRTADGSLEITLEEKAINNLNYQGGMISSWNKFCFTGGYFEANVSLPGLNNVAGLWPAIWTMGNLGRAGYGASLDGLWPYSYDSCDVGTVANQTVDGKPIAATENGDASYGGVLSYLPGQRLSRCTCSGESHPGPKHSDGTFVGRAAPEIDMLEAQVGGTPAVGQVSQSAQWAPFNAGYEWFNTSANEVVYDTAISYQNTYTGGVLQQATSVVTETDQDCYEYETGCYSIYGVEYKPGFDDAYITWMSDNKQAWTLTVAGLAADSRVDISSRPVSQEPMYLIMNLGMSHNFGDVDLAAIPFPVHLRVDYIRVYQPSDAINIGCDPDDFPTAAYIARYAEAYANPNLTTWKDDYAQEWPKNSFLGEC